ncbi:MULTISPECIES: glucodextranase DOMON-like domain-containing protein [Halobacterium]|uniref:glucodextranase DOMON-like domain-containing protein n=1 Tax=Halobacterium TaxID=2239 RepID=UPI0009EBAB91|nr:MULTISPECIES: glucodextranase DOMON-like domain-containing protein [Halobacterium]MCG1001962.1 glycoside hydrolase family 15 protein [Halobacterium noricense]
MPTLDRRTLLKLLGTGAAATVAGAGNVAAGAPPVGGDDAYWTTGEQYGVGTVADHADDGFSRVWYTLTEGALAQARFPRADLANVRTLDFLVTDPSGEYTARTFQVDRTGDALERTTEPVADDALLFRQTTTDPERGWTVTVEYAADPDGDAVLADVSFDGAGSEYDVYVVCDLALSNSGFGDDASVRQLRGSKGNGKAKGGDKGNGKAKGHGPAYALTAHDTGENDEQAVIRDENGDPYNVALALAARSGFEWASVDVIGGDSVSPLLTAGDDSTSYESASGNVALAARVGSGAALSETVALGFAEDADEAAALDEATGSLERSFDATRAKYAKSWRNWLGHVDTPASVAGDDALEPQYNFAAMTLKAAESKQFPGAGLAALCVPWGGEVQANEPSDYGYNYVWGRDLYQSATAFEAMGDVESMRAAVEYLYGVQQREDGFLPQNTYLDGRTRWGGEQLDEIAFPSLLTHQLVERHGYDLADLGFDYADVKASADYVAANGPETGQERWEEEGGLSPSTTAAEIAGLVGAAHLADDADAREDALLYLALADHWQSNTEEWMATDTGADGNGPTPYYVRVNDDRDPDDGAPRNLNNGGPTLDERAVVDAGFLELVRLGVKPADDPVVANSVSVVDDTIRAETPHGPAFYRYNGDGYGEQDGSGQYRAGAPWSLDNAGKGRLWPIFTGERAEYELLAGEEDPAALLRTMAGFANDGRMLPEQVWDREEPTAFGWEFGEGTGSATPLSWSMAQFVRLAHSLDAGEPVETPAAVRDRYAASDPPDGPSLDVSFPPRVVGEQPATVSGTTDGEEVVVSALGDTRHVPVENGSFETTVELPDGETRITVVAADGGDVADAGTTVARKTVAYADVGAPVAEFDDVTGDDYGPGHYTYPTADVFEDGVFDIDTFGVYETDETAQFLVSLAGPLTNPWGGNGFSLQAVQVYLSNPSADSGTTTAREGVNATFEAPYQRRVVVEGWNPPQVEAPDGATVTSDVAVSAYPSLDALKIELPKSAFDGSVTDQRIAPLVLSQEGSGPGRIRQIQASNSGYQFGGARNDNAPNVVDLVTPDGVTNADALAYTDSEKATIPYVDL